MQLGYLAIVVAIAALPDVASAQNVDNTLMPSISSWDGPRSHWEEGHRYLLWFQERRLGNPSIAAPNYTGSIYIDSKSMERESLRRALKTCAGYEQHAHCRGSVTGIVTELGTPG